MEGLEMLSGEQAEMSYNPFGTSFMLNVELCKDKLGSPVIMFSDWTTEGKEKDFFALHIKEAIELKGMIDKAILSWCQHEIDDLKMDKQDVKGDDL